MVALAREMNFTAAAKRTHVAQPALSQNIKQIEDELGVQLFERNTHKVVLTTAGKVFYQEAVATLEHLERTVRATQGAAQGEAGALSIGFTTTAMLGELPSLISNFRKRFPNIQVLFRELPLNLLVDALRIGAVDIGCSDNDVIDEMLESAPLKAVPVVVVLNKAHPLAQHSSLRLDMLASETFILPAPDSHPYLYNIFLNACRESGFEPVNPYFVDTIPAGIGLVSANIGITLQHRLHSFQWRDVVYRRLASPKLRLHMRLVWRKQDLSPTAMKFISESRLQKDAGGHAAIAGTRNNAFNR
jgi:DNA-binding transcriptional LysR family regulator